MKNNKKPENKKRNHYFQLCILILFSFILYVNTIKNEYSLDDELVVYNNEKIEKGISGIYDIFSSFYYSSETNGKSFGYRPIALTSFAIEYSIFGKNPHVNHFINVLLYSITALLLFLTLKRLLTDFNKFLPFVITLLFIAHPIHTEVVASLKNREEILSFLFGLMSLNLIFEYCRNNKTYYLLLGILLFVVAFLSKENAIVFVMIIPLSIYFFSDSSLKTILSVFVLLLFTGIMMRLMITHYFPANYTSVFEESPLKFTNSMTIKLSAAMLVLGFYLKILIYPHPLLFYYGYNTIPVEDFSVYSILFLVLHIFILGFALKGIKKKKLISYGILFYLISISMFSNIILPINGIVGERFAYIASLGFCMVLAILLFNISKIDIKNISYSKKSLKILFLLTLVIVIPYSAKTISRNKAWFNHITLYSSDIEYLTKSAKANELISDWLYIHLNEMPFAERQEALKKIEKYYKRSLNIYPNNAQACNNLGTLFFEERRNADSAIVYFEKCLKVDSSYTKAYFNIAQCYSALSMPKKAQYYYKKFLKSDTSYFKKTSDLSMKYFAAKNYKQAIKLNERLIRMDAGSYIPYYNLANIYIQLGDTIRGLLFAEKYLELNPGNKNFAQKTSEFYRMMGNNKKADYYFNLANPATNHP